MENTVVDRATVSLYLAHKGALPLEKCREFVLRASLEEKLENSKPNNKKNDK